MATKAEAVKAAAKALLFAAGMAHSVATADIQQAASTIARNYGETNSRQIEEEIRQHIRNGG